MFFSTPWQTGGRHAGNIPPKRSSTEPTAFFWPFYPGPFWPFYPGLASHPLPSGPGRAAKMPLLLVDPLIPPGMASGR